MPPPDTSSKARLLKIVLNVVEHNLGEDDTVFLANDRVLEGAPVAHLSDVIHTLSRCRVVLIAKAKYFDKVNAPAPSIWLF